MKYVLKNPPDDERDRELWMQHGAGFIVFKDMRNYAIDRIPADVDPTTRSLIIKGINDTVYGLMMIMDGVSGSLQNEDYSLRIQNKIILQRKDDIVQEIDTVDGDGMCMGFHDWIDGDFGEDDICE